jgi:peptide/nickel transport system substrate-binding protein
MFTKNRIGLMMAVLLVVALVLVACQPASQVVEVTRIVTETITEEGQEVVVTSVVTEVEEVVVTATPEPVEEVSMVAPDPTTYVVQTFGDIGTLDPALGYDTASNTPIQNIYETLIWYNGPDPTTYVPLLATEVPSVENGGISEDGMVYTFHSRGCHLPRRRGDDPQRRGLQLPARPVAERPERPAVAVPGADPGLHLR